MFDLADMPEISDFNQENPPTVFNFLTFRRVSEGLFTAKLSDLAINHAILELSRIPLDQTWTIWERISNASRSNA